VVPRELDDVVVRAQRGDAAAFRELFVQHRTKVARIAFRMLGPSADLDDVVQDVFLQVHRSLPDFRGQSKFTTWLHRVSVNVVLMARRRAKSRPRYANEEAGRHEAATNPGPDREVTRLRRRDAFRRLLDRLSEKKRTVFVLHELEGMSPTDIAEVADCPVLTVRTRLFYARRELAQMMRSEPSLAQLVLEHEAADANKQPHGKETQPDASEPDATLERGSHAAPTTSDSESHPEAE